MLSLVILCGVCCGLASVSCSGDMGPGIWKVNYINKCEDSTHAFKFDVTQEKINRTHDGFNAKFRLEEPFTNDFGILMDICKYVDGGCKQYQVMSDICFATFVNKYAEKNVRTGLEIANVDPPEFPIPAGEYEVNKFIFDYSELPSDCAYGEYDAQINILRGTLVVGIVDIQVEFVED